MLNSHCNNNENILLLLLVSIHGLKVHRAFHKAMGLNANNG